MDFSQELRGELNMAKERFKSVSLREQKHLRQIKDLCGVVNELQVKNVFNFFLFFLFFFRIL